MQSCQTESADFFEAFGHVTAVQGEWVQVTIEQQGCGRCHEPGGCGGQSLTQMLNKPQAYWVRNTIQAVEGERVSVLMPPKQVNRAAWLAYLRPLLLLFVGAAAGSIVGGGELYSILGALLGLAFGFIGLKRAARSVTSSESHLNGAEIPLNSEPVLSRVPMQR